MSVAVISTNDTAAPKGQLLFAANCTYTSGPIIVNWGPADGPTAILDTLAFLSTFAMGAYCVTLLLVNNRTLPKPIRPGIVSNVIIALGAVFYLGMLFYSMLRFGVTDMG